MVDTVRTDAEILVLLADNTTGAISAQVARDAYVTQRGTCGALVEQTSSFTLALAHVTTGVILCTHASTPIVITIPANATVALPLNAILNFAQWGAAAVTFAAAGGVTLRIQATYGTAIREQYGVVTLWKAATNEWLLFGALADA